MLICAEGIDGSGKSTQCKRLYESLKENHDVIITREPGGSPIADKIREVIINNKMDELTEYLLFSAARNEHMINTIIPALEKNKIVICDRFIDSTWVYQPNIPNNLRCEVDDEVTQKGYFSDITFILDIPTELAMERSKSRGNMNEFDNRSLDFFKNARNAYLNRAEGNESYHVINADRQQEEIAKEILDIVMSLV